MYPQKWVTKIYWLPFRERWGRRPVRSEAAHEERGTVRVNGGEAGSAGVRESQKSLGDSWLGGGGGERVTAKALEGGGCG